MTRTSSGLLVAGVALVATLATGCSVPRHSSGSPATVPSAATSSQPVAAAATVAPVTPAAASASTAAGTTGVAPAAVAPAAPAGAAAAANASTLAAVNQDLAGIDAGSSAADNEVSQGDSARAQDDDS